MSVATMPARQARSTARAGSTQKSARRARLRLVAPARRSSSRRRLPFLILASLVVGVLAVGVVSMQALVSQTSFRIQDLTQRTQGMELSYGQLRLEIAQLSSPARVAAAAHRLGLALPASVATLSVKGLTPVPPGRQSGSASFALKGVLGEHP